MLSPGMQRRPKILLVDDDVELCLLVTSFLSESGFEVTSELDGLKGLKSATERKPDLVVLDVMLPALMVSECSTASAVRVPSPSSC